MGDETFIIQDLRRHLSGSGKVEVGEEDTSERKVALPVAAIKSLLCVIQR
eukprot:CAMPEP_0197247492 /NCGR_PEP_ID=MMETSP1429-20130617/29231_1 /TAXON_ID=49237 /ORGANISM="Chaetoceros  sp., Strain UNC1202" /LENGTH=49 /DNA_ID= /DNA_START= /DNA_END= /DNA_ORIENTATION=